jgi:carboxyl-terminal processing protease
MLKYTISNFYRVAGTTTQKYGVKPDIVMPSVYDHMEIGEEHLPNSLEPDKIPAAKFQQLNRAKTYIESLKEDSRNRVDQSTDFGYVKADIARYLELKERESISLNESVRITEKEEDKGRSDARKSERKARPEPKESVFLLTLDATKNAEELVPLPYLAASEPETEETEEEKKEDDSEEADKAKSEETEDVEDEDEDTRQYDPHLREALNILSDYIDALKKAPPVDSNSNVS